MVIKKFRFVFLFAAILLIVFGCGTKQLIPFSWTEHIRWECMSGETAVEKAQAEVVILKAKKKSEGVLAVTIKAPDIYEGLMEWLNTVPEEDFTDENLETEIIKLLSEADPSENTVELSYTKSKEGVKIAYTQEFANLISCGMVRFYNDCMLNAITELGGNQ